MTTSTERDTVKQFLRKTDRRVFYRRRGIAEDTNGEAFKNRMREEGRCLIRVRVNRVVQPPTPAPRAPGHDSLKRI